MPLKNAFSRAIFGYKRQKPDSVPITSGRSPVSRLDIKKYDILPTRRNDDELDMTNSDAVHKARIAREGRQVLPTFEIKGEDQILNEDHRESNLRLSCDDDMMMDFKSWPNPFDESNQRDAATQTERSKVALGSSRQAMNEDPISETISHCGIELRDFEISTSSNAARSAYPFNDSCQSNLAVDQRTASSPSFAVDHKPTLSAPCQVYNEHQTLTSRKFSSDDDVMMDFKNLPNPFDESNQRDSSVSHCRTDKSKAASGSSCPAINEDCILRERRLVCEKEIRESKIGSPNTSYPLLQSCQRDVAVTQKTASSLPCAVTHKPVSSPPNQVRNEDQNDDNDIMMDFKSLPNPFDESNRGGAAISQNKTARTKVASGSPCLVIDEDHILPRRSLNCENETRVFEAGSSNAAQSTYPFNESRQRDVSVTQNTISSQSCAVTHKPVSNPSSQVCNEDHSYDGHPGIMMDFKSLPNPFDESNQGDAVVSHYKADGPTNALGSSCQTLNETRILYKRSVNCENEMRESTTGNSNASRSTDLFNDGSVTHKPFTDSSCAVTHKPVSSSSTSQVCDKNRKVSNKGRSSESETRDLIMAWQSKSTESNPFDESSERVTHSKFYGSKTASGSSYLRQTVLGPAASEKESVHVQPSNEDTPFGPFDDILSRRCEYTKTTKQQPSDTKKIIPHVSPISPLKSRTLAPSPLSLRSPGPPASGTFLPALDSPGPCLSKLHTPKPGAPSDVPVFVQTRRIAMNASRAPSPSRISGPSSPPGTGRVPSPSRRDAPQRSGYPSPGRFSSPSRRDTPPKGGQRRGSTRNSPVSPFANHTVARQSETSLRRTSLEILPQRHEQTSDLRLQRKSNPSTAQEFKATHPFRGHSSSKSTTRNNKQSSLLPAPFLGGLTLPEMEDSTANNEFDRLAERRRNIRFKEDPYTREYKEVHRRTTEQPSPIASQATEFERPAPISIRFMKFEQAVQAVSPRSTQCLSEDLGSSIRSSRIPEKGKSAPLKVAESVDRNGPKEFPLASRRIPDLTPSTPVKSAESIDYNGRREKISGSNSSINVVREASCVAGLDELEGNARVPLSESRRVLNSDDPYMCTFWVTDADGLCEHLELDVENAQPISRLEDFSAHKGALWRSSKTLEIEGMGSHEAGTFSRNCMTPSKKASRRRKLKASLSFRSNTSKSRLRRSFSFSSVR